MAGTSPAMMSWKFVHQALGSVRSAQRALPTVAVFTLRGVRTLA